MNIACFHQSNVVLGEAPFYDAESTVLVVGDAVPQQCRGVGLTLWTIGGAKMRAAALGSTCGRVFFLRIGDTTNMRFTTLGVNGSVCNANGLAPGIINPRPIEFMYIK